ncbi:MAG: LamG-like jellyroll fold domain-containing protein [Saprospiraceae bacterium]
MKSNTSYLPVLILLFLLNTNFATGQSAIIKEKVEKMRTIYHFPPPMNDPSFPFKTVTINSDSPEWAKLLYKVNPNIAQIRELYFQWRAANPTIKNGHTRNFRKLSGYLAQHDYVNEAGFIDIPTNEEVKATSAQILADRSKFKRQTAKSANNTTWQLHGPNVMMEKDGVLANRHINIYSLTQCLTNMDVLYCTSESGGTVFKTTDRGDNWFSISDNLLTSMGSRNIEVAPSHPDTVYLCTRDDIWKTSTGNDDWVSIYDEYKSENRTLIIHPASSDTVLAGGDNGILKTTDGGANWTNPLAGKIFDLRYKPGDTQTIYALVDNPTTKQCDFYKSTDGGNTWTVRATGWPNETSNSTKGGKMTTSDGNPAVIYAFVGATWTNSPEGVNAKILKSTDSGESWTTVVDYDNSFGINDGQGYYDWDIEVSDTDANIVYGGTQNRWVTFDGFQTIAKSGGSLGHSDVQETLFNGSDLWVANDGGIIQFADETFESYTPKTNGINAISYWSFDQGWNKDVTSATHYHNGTSFTNEDYSTATAYSLGGAEPSFSLVEQPNGNRVVSKGYGSVNGYKLPNSPSEAYRRFEYNLTPNIHSYGGNNVAIDFRANQTHYLGAENDLMKSDDFGVTWSSIYSFPLESEKVWDVELTRANPDAIFISTIDNSGGNIYRSLDGGQSFTEIILPSQFNNPKVMNISVSNEDENIFYVMGDRWGIKMAKTTDGGATWTDLNTSTLDPYDGEKIMQVDGTDGGIYLVTSRAVFYRNNTLTDWVALTAGMPANTSYEYIRPFYRDNEVRIATSRGTYSANLYDTPQLSNALVQPTVNKGSSECVRDTFYFDDFSVIEHAGATWSWSFPGATYVSATDVRNPKVVYGNGGQHDVTMSITKGGQIYTKTITNMLEINDLCSTIDGFAGQGLQLNAETEDRANMDFSGVVTNNFTFTGWVKIEGDLTAFATIFSNNVWCAHCNDQTLGLEVNYYGNSLWYRWPNSTSGWASTTGLTLPTDEWVYVAMVMSPDKVTVMVNEQKWEETRAHDPVDLGQLYFGGGFYSKYLNGMVDEATFWKRALSEQEVKELMHLTKDPSGDPDLLAYYQFNEPAGNVIDKAGIYPARLLNSATRPTSSVPVGAGVSATQTEMAGSVAFANTGFTAEFLSQSGAEVVASKINVAPYNLNGLQTDDLPLAEEYWAIHRYGTGGFGANLTFQVGKDLTTAEANMPELFSLYKRGNRSDADWTLVTTANAVDAATDEITFAAQADEWSQYMIAGMEISLAVEWLNFAAELTKANQVALNWEVNAETNTNHYLVERSADGKTFATIGKVAATRSSQYEFLDVNPLTGINYYRLQEVENSGRSSYSDLRKVILQNTDKVSLFPNPTNGIVEISATEVIESVTIFNALGEIVQQFSNVQMTTFTNQLDLTTVATGVYFIEVETMTGRVIQRIVRE